MGNRMPTPYHPVLHSPLDLFIVLRMFVTAAALRRAAVECERSLCIVHILTFLDLGCKRWTSRLPDELASKLAVSNERAHEAVE